MLSTAYCSPAKVGWAGRLQIPPVWGKPNHFTPIIRCAITIKHHAWVETYRMLHSTLQIIDI